MRSLAVVLLILALHLPGLARAGEYDGKRDERLREEVHRIDVPGTGASIVLTSFRPSGDGPFPWLVLSHGTATTPEANRALGRYRPLNPVREWVARGYAVLVPVRRGYGASGGTRLGDDYGGCRHADFRRAGEGAWTDLRAAIEWARGQPDLHPDRWLLAGQSAGGFASLYAASKQPAGLQAVLAFSSGRAGNPETRKGEPCASDRYAALISEIAPRIRVPVLWFYAENDAFIGPRVQRLWFDAFRTAGGRGEFHVIEPFPSALGHGVFPSAAGRKYWIPAVVGFFREYGVSLPFPADRNRL